MGMTAGHDGGDFNTHIDAKNWEAWTKRPANAHAPHVTPTAPDTPLNARPPEPPDTGVKPP